MLIFTIFCVSMDTCGVLDSELFFNSFRFSHEALHNFVFCTILCYERFCALHNFGFYTFLCFERFCALHNSVPPRQLFVLCAPRAWLRGTSSPRFPSEPDLFEARWWWDRRAFLRYNDTDIRAIYLLGTPALSKCIYQSHLHDANRSFIYMWF